LQAGKATTAANQKRLTEANEAGMLHFSGGPSLTFPLDTVSAFLPKELLGSRFCLGLGKANN
jgi:hypothetical protein